MCVIVIEVSDSHRVLVEQSEPDYQNQMLFIIFV